MKTRILFILMVIISGLVSVGYSDDLYKIIYDYAYEAGVESGMSDKADGYSYSPEEVLSDPGIQMVITALKQKVGHSEDVVDLAFRDGFIAGYKKGYYK
ncbi:hypothetical protein SAMN02745216_02993 [Desulfatibacillum alkenivorans DSM 16219]|jgi:hypothetical protein|uniref:Uncharacterized protein n=1 Tax=Desulfatibacillum alkenivorans DSM 16219 TaxID=1121393 RepID=A0A1M6Q8D4_9BACT|nr:hypothetical protein [Desulfatibacillum alkenivorans]SHK16461.1 hypothetical protein SAMN02745216_02993 [Desulfatibacillum alkenivorans DSM 16219]